MKENPINTINSFSQTVNIKSSCQIDKILSIGKSIPNAEPTVKCLDILGLLEKKNAFCICHGEKSKDFKKPIGRWNYDEKDSYTLSEALSRCSQENGLLLGLILKSNFFNSNLACLDVDYEIKETTQIQSQNQKDGIFHLVCNYFEKQGLNFWAEQSTKGVHVFFQRPEKLKNTTCVDIKIENRTFHCDLKVNGYIALAANRRGNLSFRFPQKDTPLSVLPTELFSLVQKEKEVDTTANDIEGERNNNSYKRAIKLLTKGLTKDNVWEILNDENNKREKPLKTTELQTIFNSALKSDLYQSYLNKKATVDIDAGEIAKAILKEYKDKFIIGPTEKGKESLYFSEAGILKEFSNSWLGNFALNYIPSLTRCKLFDIKENLLALLNKAGKKIESWQNLETKGILLDNNSNVFNIYAEQIEIKDFSDYIANGGKPFRSNVNFTLNTSLIKLGFEAGNDSEFWLELLQNNCPNWFEFLSKTIKVEDLLPFLEMVGNFFIPVNSVYRRAFFFLVGQPESGKSVVLDYLTENILQIPPQVFDPVKAGNNFDLAWLLTGTNRAICNDGKRGFIKRNDIFNALAEGGSLRVEGKGKDVTTIKRPTSCIVATNHPPKSIDNSGAFETRCRSILFFKRYSQKDFTLPDKLWNERNTFNNLALGRLFYLIKNGLDFTQTAASKTPNLFNQFGEDDPLSQFLHLNFEYTGLTSDKLEISEITEKLREFCESLGVESFEYIGNTGKLFPKVRKIIADELKSKGAKNDLYWAGKTVRGFSGVKISSIS